MSKPYLNPIQQVQHLITRKGLIVRDTAFAERKLIDIEYTSLIGGYKTPFINPMTRMYEGFLQEPQPEHYRLSLKFQSGNQRKSF